MIFVSGFVKVTRPRRDALRSFPVADADAPNPRPSLSPSRPSPARLPERERRPGISPGAKPTRLTD